MKLTDFDYHLPKNLIANSPANPRDHSKLMVINKTTQKISHHHFYDLVDLLTENDVLVFNNTKVIPARIYGTKEILLLKNLNNFEWEILIKGKTKVGDKINFDGFECEILKKEELVATVKFNIPYLELLKKLDQIGHTPLPPYIESDEDEKKLREIYQTIYAKENGSVAAPTAGLHFTKALLEKLKNKNIQMEYITLHVGLGTFAPVKMDDTTKHKMHSEYFEIDRQTSDRINTAKQNGKRIIAVGTTTARALESVKFPLHKFQGETDIFIYPPYHFQVIDGLITNFHLPKSTLLALVSAFAGIDLIKKSYEEAIKNNYRFFSFGDSSLII